jgi:hypothetical protein
MSQTAQSHNATVGTTSSGIPNGKNRTLPKSSIILHSLTTVISGVAMFAFLFNKLGNYDLVLAFLSKTNWWIVGAVLGAGVGLYVSFHLYLSNKHP